MYILAPCVCPAMPYPLDTGTATPAAGLSVFPFHSECLSLVSAPAPTPKDPWPRTLTSLSCALAPVRLSGGCGVGSRGGASLQALPRQPPSRKQGQRDSERRRAKRVTSNKHTQHADTCCVDHLFSWSPFRFSAAVHELGTRLLRQHKHRTVSARNHCFSGIRKHPAPMRQNWPKLLPGNHRGLSFVICVDCGRRMSRF